MADTIALTLTANGSDIDGDSTVTSMGRADTIEVLSFEQTIKTAYERASLRATGRRIYVPLRFTKRIDRSSPLLRQALLQNQEVAGSFRWFRNNASGDGTTEHFFTLAFTGGRITQATLRLPDTLDPASTNLPPLEDIELVFNGVTWTYEPGGVETNDSLDAHV